MQTMATYSHFMEGMCDDAVDRLDEASAVNMRWTGRECLARQLKANPQLRNPSPS
jgi:hypothetical protein